MNKSEVLEIRKQFTPANCNITRISACYVNHDKEKEILPRQAFLALAEEEAFKYFDIFKHTLSGSIGKNMLNMEFPLEQERDGGTQDFLLKLKESHLEDDAILEAFYDKIIENFDYPEHYAIILIHGLYDIPGKATDGSEMFDASDSVYEYVLCSICPVKLSKPGLSYNSATHTIENRTRDWIIDAPQRGFIFPAFTERDTDIHGLLYYSKKAEDLQPEFIEAVLGTNLTLSAGGQKESFQTVISETVGEDCDYEIIKNIHENLNELIEEHKEDKEPLELCKEDVKRLLAHSGVEDEKLEDFDKKYDDNVGARETLMAANIADTRKFSIETPDVVIKVNPERTDLIETRIIDDREYIMIAVDSRIEVNGVSVRTTTTTSADSEIEDEVPFEE